MKLALALVVTLFLPVASFSQQGGGIDFRGQKPAFPLVFPAGTKAAPSITSTGSPVLGIYWPNAFTMAWAYGGQGFFQFDAATPAFTSGSSNYIGWSSNIDATLGALDTRFSRVSAGIVRTETSSGNSGAHLAAVAVTINTGAAAPGNTDSGRVYVNTGDADGSTITLPNDPAAGLVFTIVATAAQNITVAPSAGETLMFGNTICATSFVVGGVATGIGDSATIVSATAGSGAVWITTASAGTPVCTP